MAEMQGLYFGMGIDTSQLHSDFMNAEKTINQNLRRINQEMEKIQLRGQMQIDGLDESATQLEKVKIQEEALAAQMELQKDKILLVSKAYEYLVRTRGENAEVSKQMELQLAREEYAMQKLEDQMKNLENQTKVAFDMNMEMLGTTELLFKLVDRRVEAGLALPFALAPAQAKVAIGATMALASAIKGTSDATEELREKNPAQLLDEEMDRMAGSVDNSWQRINESNKRGMEQVRSYYNRPYQGNYYYRDAKQQQAELQKTAEQIQKVKEESQSAEEALKSFATEILGIKKLDTGDLKIFPEVNFTDIISFVKVIEDFRASESLFNIGELIKNSDSAIGKLASTLTGLWYLNQKIREPITEFAQAAIENFRELSKAASELNLPLERTNDFLEKIALTGAEYDDVRDFVRGVQDAVIKGDSEDPEVLALEKYDVVIQDAQGKLLAFDETLEQLYQGYLKAREAGEAEAYVIMTNGQAVQDVMPYFEKLAQAEEDIGKIKWSTLDSATLSNVSHEMKLLEVQTNEFENALSSLMAPAAEIAFQKLFENVKSLTETIEDNRDEIIYWTFVLTEALGVVDEFKSKLSSGAKETVISFGETLQGINEEYGITDTLKNFFADEPVPIPDLEEEAKERFIPFYQELKKLDEELGVISEIKSLLPEEFTGSVDHVLKEYLVPFHKELKSIEEEFSIVNRIKSFMPDLPDDFFGTDEEDSIFTRAQERLEKFKKENEEAREEVEETENSLEGLSYSLNRIAKYRQELEGLQLDIKFGGGDSYQKKIEQNKIWYEEAMKDARQYANEQAIIEELNSARLEQIEQDRAAKLQEIRDSVAALDKTALENKIADIEKEKQAWIEKGMEEAEAEQLAQEKIRHAREQTEAELDAIRDSVAAADRTDLENKLANIEKEKQAWIQKGMEEAEAEQLAQEKIRQAHEQTEATLDEIRDSVAALDRTDLENKLANIEKERQAWIKKGMDEIEAAELAQKKINKAYQEGQEERAKAISKAYEDAGLCATKLLIL